MKKILSFAAIAMFGFAAFTSCTKKSTSPGYTMGATINGHSYSSNAVSGKNGTILSVWGYTSATAISYPNISIVLANYAAAGTYSLDGIFTAVTIDSSSTSAVTSSYGTVVITSTSPLKGTFSATMTDSTKITNGSFTAQAQ